MIRVQKNQKIINITSKYNDYPPDRPFFGAHILFTFIYYGNKWHYYKQ